MRRAKIIAKDRAHIAFRLLRPIFSDQPFLLLQSEATADSAISAFQGLPGHSNMAPQCLRGCHPRQPGSNPHYPRNRAVDPVEGEHTLVNSISREDLVGPFAREDYLDVLASEPGNVVQRNATGVRERLIQVP